jgi:hypothetical protein
VATSARHGFARIVAASGIHASLAQKIELEAADNLWFDSAAATVLERQRIGRTLDHARTASDEAVAVGDLDFAHVLEFFEAGFGTDLPAEVDALAAIEVELDMPARLLEMASSLDPGLNLNSQR